MFKKILFGGGLVFMFFSCDHRHADYVEGFYYSEKSNYHTKKKAYDKAQTALLLSKEKLSERYELDSNLAVLFDLLDKKDEAEKSFEAALKMIEQNYPSETAEKKAALFLVYYNRGVYYQGLQKIDEALQSYQSALDIDPTSIEIKTNIELMLQNQQGQGQGQQKSESDQKGDPQSEEKSNDKNDKNDKSDDKENDKSDDNQENEEKTSPETKPSPKYQPRPFKGDQLSEGDVKKILGELSQQDKKIRSQFDKKEREEVGIGIDGKNEKDW